MIRKLISLFLLTSMVSLNGLGAFAAGVKTAQTEKSANTLSGSVTSAQPVVEHMDGQKNQYLNTVKILEGKAVIASGNVIKVKFAQEFNSKNAKAGDKIIFILDEDLNTKESTKLFPKGTQIIGTVQGVEPVKMWNKNAKVMISLGEIKLPNDERGLISARVYSKDSTLRRSGWAAFSKGAEWTVGMFGVGAGVGAGIGAAASAVGIGCFAIGMPVGAGLGLIAGFVTPGLNYKAKPGKKVEIQLTQDLEICLNKI